MVTADPFQQDLIEIGFRFVQEGRRGVMQFSRPVTTFLTIWAHHDPGDQTVLLTWEHALGAYLDTLGLQIGSNEPLNAFLFPQRDVRGPAEIDFVVAELDRIEQRLAGLDLLAP